MDFSTKFFDVLGFIKKKLLIDLLEVFDFFYAKIYFALILFFNFLLWVSVLYINFKVSDNTLILHYNVDLGVDLIGPSSNLYIIPLLGLLIFIVNLALLLIFLKWSDYRFLAHLLFSASLLANIFLIISLGPIYLINFR
ncbi:hypothetical protein K8R62_04205 [bacterium]|nr:hypothetical protein [bacterium]